MCSIWPAEMPVPQSVTAMACYAALYMGFSEIVLLGCDHDWILHLDTSTHKLTAGFGYGKQVLQITIESNGRCAAVVQIMC